MTAAANAVRDAATAINRSTPSPILEHHDDDLFVASVPATEERPWQGVLTENRFFFQNPDGAGWIGSTYTATPTSGVRELNLRGVGGTLRVTQGNCPAPRLEDRLPTLATLALGGRAHDACAGPFHAPIGLAGTSWLILRIGNQLHPDLESSETITVNTLTFGQSGRVGGTIACNDAGFQDLRWTQDGFERMDGAEEEKGDDGDEDSGGEADRDLFVTEIACNLPASEAFGRTALTSLYEAESWSIVGDQLVIDLPEGERLVGWYLGSDVFAEAGVEIGSPVAEESEAGPVSTGEVEIEGGE
ncbi:hypothetical protein B5C34_09605 [Pacificimonas flava]|uniref:Uncharacterized protein n=2 Tax=Pacificimonas TaxID=1960290 RepID=A0A219B5P3_9SPHN|nr:MULTISPECIES: hypothetical protein [Pacificimonas]MBZ6379074.1 hypothetical protein [Pacificimonas aurantium]OWV33690.1 hypothetical protein B5C34_09605 [Pacificimonas flava]